MDATFPFLKREEWRLFMGMPRTPSAETRAGNTNHQKFSSRITPIHCEWPPVEQGLTSDEITLFFEPITAI